MLSKEAICAGIDDMDAETYAAARQRGYEPHVAIRTVDFGKCLRLCGLERAAIAGVILGILTRETLMDTMEKACKQCPKDTDKLMGYFPVTDESLYQPQESMEAKVIHKNSVK